MEQYVTNAQRAALSADEQASVVANAEAGGLSWGGHFTHPRPDPVHFFHDPGNRKKRIADAQKQFEQGDIEKCR